jgi:hypothetical protein
MGSRSALLSRQRSVLRTKAGIIGANSRDPIGLADVLGFGESFLHVAQEVIYLWFDKLYFLGFSFGSPVGFDWGAELTGAGCGCASVLGCGCGVGRGCVSIRGFDSTRGCGCDVWIGRGCVSALDGGCDSGVGRVWRGCG